MNNEGLSSEDKQFNDITSVMKKIGLEKKQKNFYARAICIVSQKQYQSFKWN